jgi:signal transduction histidine kinase
MRQVISNLVGNALAHGAADSQIKASGVDDDKTVRIDIHNLGEPIPADRLDDIFDPLKRLPKTGARGVRSDHGIGLGLFIVKEVIDAHGGSVCVTSSREAGTTFTVTLPKKKRLQR